MAVLKRAWRLRQQVRNHHTSGIADILLVCRTGGGRKKDVRKWAQERSDAELELIYKMTRVHLRDIK